MVLNNVSWFSPSFFAKVTKMPFSKSCNSTGAKGMALNQKLQTNSVHAAHCQIWVADPWGNTKSSILAEKLVNQKIWKNPTENQYWNQYQNQYPNQYFHQRNQYPKYWYYQYFLKNKYQYFFHRKILIEINIGCSGKFYS